MEKNNKQFKGVQIFVHSGRDRALNINLCITFVKPFICVGIRRMKAGLFCKSGNVYVS